MNRRIHVLPTSIVSTGALAVVNASNESALLGGGVSRALFDECGGQVLQDEMHERLRDDLDGALELGDCLVTSGGSSTRIRWILHVPAVDYRGPRAVLGARGVVRAVTSVDRVLSLIHISEPTRPY